MTSQANSSGPVARAEPWNIRVLCEADRSAIQAHREPGLPKPSSATKTSGSIALHTALAAGMDRLSHGVALFDAEGHAHYANAAARALLGRLGWSRDEADQPTTPSDWAPALRQVCQRGRRELQRITVKDISMLVVLVPLSVSGQELAFAVFGREELCGSVELQMFALHHQLTHAETVVLRQLTRGLSAAAIAMEHGVACTTILTQIAAIRSKTRCSSVRSLLGTLARMPPMRPLQPLADPH